MVRFLALGIESRASTESASTLTSKASCTELESNATFRTVVFARSPKNRPSGDAVPVGGRDVAADVVCVRLGDDGIPCVVAVDRLCLAWRGFH